MSSIVWIKPSGVEITTNDLKETVEYLESLGYKRKGAEKTAAPEKKVAKKKVSSKKSKG